MMKPILRCGYLCGFLAACGGGGGDDAGSPVSRFTGTTTGMQISGIGASGTQVSDRVTPAGTQVDFNVTQVGDDLVRFEVLGPDGFVVDTREGGQIEFAGGDFRFQSADGNIRGLIIDRYDEMVSAFWSNSESASTAYVGSVAIGIGEPTPVGDLPTDVAIYRGITTGFAVLGNSGRIVVSDLTIQTDFSEVNFGTFNTVYLSEIDLSAPDTPLPELNLSGLAMVNGNGEFSGFANAPGAGLTGGIEGTFYGPNAESAGGTFALGAAGGDTYVGSFGSDRF